MVEGWRRPSPRGGTAVVAALEVVLVGLLVLVEPGVGIQCFHCITEECFNSPVNCNTNHVTVCNQGGSNGNLTQCGHEIVTCKEETFSDSHNDVYRNCGDPGDHGAGCEGDSCTCDTDRCNVGLVWVSEPVPVPSAGALWWWLMAVPAVAAVLLTVAVVLRLRQRRRAARRPLAAAAETAWCESQSGAVRLPGRQQDPLL